MVNSESEPQGAIEICIIDPRLFVLRGKGY